MKHYEFEITLVGYGETVSEAWEDATEGFIEEPGPPPDEYTAIEEDYDT